MIVWPGGLCIQVVGSHGRPISTRTGDPTASQVMFSGVTAGKADCFGFVSGLVWESPARFAGQDMPVRCHTGDRDIQPRCVQAACAGNGPDRACEILPSGDLHTEVGRKPGRLLVPLWGRLEAGGVTPAAVRL